MASSMTEQEILDQLKQPNVSAEYLLDEIRGRYEKLWQGNAKLYRAFTEKLIAQGHPAQALDLAREGQEFLRDDVELQYLLALAARRGGNPRYALSLLTPLMPKALDPASALPLKLRVDTVALQGGILKILSRKDPDLLTQSAQWYERAAEIPGASAMPDAGTFPLINAATVWRLAGNVEHSQALAREVIRRCESLDASACDPLWHPATLGEAHVLVGDHEKATNHYVQAVNAAIAKGRLGELASVRANIELLRAAGLTADPAFLDQHLGAVVTFSGHMVDSPERIKAGHALRFPNSPKLIEAVKDAIANILEDLNAKVGFCSLACGGDLLFAKAMLARNAELHIVLPFAQHDFLRTSVNFGQTGEEWRRWRVMFDEVLDAVPANRVRYSTQEPFLGSNDLFHFSNQVLQGLAVMRAKERASFPQAVVLLDPNVPGQAGGARSYADHWSASGYETHLIDLSQLRAVVSEADSLPRTRTAPAAPTPVSSLKRPVKSLLFADLAGFSRIPEWQLAEFLEDYGRFLHELFVSPIGGAATYVNTWGDAIYAVFDNVTDTAAFALELIEPTVATAPDWSKHEMGESSPFRVGVHSGPVFELQDTFQGRSAFSGQHVSRAARIEPATMRGCVYASEPFAALLTMEGNQHFHIESAGVHRLAKDYDRCQLYRVERGVPSISS
jgi:class 3 adenylate cyclase